MLCRSLAILTILLAYAQSAAATDVQFGSLALQWPDGFTPVSAKPPFQLKGPNGETVLVTVMRQRSEPTREEGAAEQEKTVAFGERFMRAQGEKAGGIMMPIERTKLADGTVMCHVTSKTSGLFRTGYFSQYMLVSPVGRLAFLTVEGTGDASTEHLKYIAPVSSARWLE